jgi:hypothetical protein
MGYGLKIITGIFDSMNESNSNKSEIRINDLYDKDNIPSGTEVYIFIPDGYIFELAKPSGRK